MAVRSNSWTDKDHATLRALYAKKRDSELAAILNRTVKAVRSRARLLRLTKGTRKLWSAGEETFLREQYPHRPAHELVPLLGRTLAMIYRRAWVLGIEKDAEYLAKFKEDSKDRLRKVGISGRFVKGQIPANKGTRRPGWAPGRMASTQFKKGQRAGAAQNKWCPVGTVKLNADGYLRRKIADEPEAIAGKGGSSTNWEFVHRRVWEDAHGPIPPGHRIWWKDGNHLNCALENLELLSDQDHMARTTIHNMPKPLKEVLILKGAIRRQITLRRKANAQKQTTRSA
jgi:hypothetical protein